MFFHLVPKHFYLIWYLKNVFLMFLVHFITNVNKKKTIKHIWPMEKGNKKLKYFLFFYLF